jgi:hypothetical protein
MAINVTSLIASLEAEYLANETKLAALPAPGFSLDGLSISPDSSRDSLTKRQQEIAKLLAGLGAPIGGVNGLGMPFRVGSTWRA